MGAQRIRKSPNTVTSLYTAFDQLDGHHPLMEALPNGYVPYQVRELGKGEVAYFNFPLAKEMGLIPESHPNELSGKLIETLIQTFSIQIINEYDQSQGRKFSASRIKPHPYMASRYLQLQHTNKRGTTSGDGRGIWNGVVRHQGKTWDVSSRGTGVTCLAPGAVEAKRPLQTGTTDFGYGCGLAEIDELYSASILAEIIHLQGIPTERVLCIIDLGNGHGIGVRAALNLLRPAHIFLYLKQNRIDELVKAVDYFLERQIQNKRWSPRHKRKSRYEELAFDLAERFGRFAAQLESGYVFQWLDWDGDNVLVDAGILDYGSVRQFGLRHDLYRYDDVQRYSTNLNEQRQKARLTVQVFCQISDAIATRAKKPLKTFATHPALKVFDQTFQQSIKHLLLQKVGFTKRDLRQTELDQKSVVEFFKVFDLFERAKVSSSLRKVPDGVNTPPLFDMRAFLRIMADHVHKQGLKPMDNSLLFRQIRSTFAKSIRPERSRAIQKNLKVLQKSYLNLIQHFMGRTPSKQVLLGFSQQANVMNRENRITGNAVIEIVEELLNQRKKGAAPEMIQGWIDQLILANLAGSDDDKIKYYLSKPKILARPDVLEKLMSIIHEHRHDI